MLKAVIFDMDGVIIDSEPVHYEVNKMLFKKLGINVPEEEYNLFIGSSNTNMWTYFKEKYRLKQSVAELSRRQADSNLEYLKNSHEKPIPGVVELLHELKKEGITIALASSSPIMGIQLVLEIFNIKEYFKVIISGEDFERSKPNPDIFIKTAELLDIDPKECVVIEDSTNGVRAAKEAGMKVIGFQNVNSGNQDLSLADYIVDSMKSINVNLIKELL